MNHAKKLYIWTRLTDNNQQRSTTDQHFSQFWAHQEVVIKLLKDQDHWRWVLLRIEGRGWVWGNKNIIFPFLLGVTRISRNRPRHCGAWMDSSVNLSFFPKSVLRVNALVLGAPRWFACNQFLVEELLCVSHSLFC